MSGIAVNGLRFAYGAHEVLRGVSFRHGAGVMCVMGPNGVGKSTLFRCLLGLERGFMGSIVIDGVDVKSAAPHTLAGLCAYVPQSQSPRAGYTVMEMVMMGAAARQVLMGPGRKERRAAEVALERVGIAQLAKRDCARISGGERQLVLIARALAQNAHLLVMDEPTANLDYGNQLRVLSEIRHLGDEGYSIVLSTHHPEQALRWGDAALALQDGSVVAVGAPGKVIDAVLIERLYGAKVCMERTQTGHLIAVPL